MNMKSFASGLAVLALSSYVMADITQRFPEQRAWLLLPIWFLVGLLTMIVFVKYMTKKSYKSVAAPAAIIFAFSFGLTYFMGNFFWFAFFKKIIVGIQCEAFVGITLKLIELFLVGLFVLVTPILLSILVQSIISRLFFPNIPHSRLFVWLLGANSTFFIWWIVIVSGYYMIMGLPLDYITCFTFA
jgi:hypothetical protein